MPSYLAAGRCKPFLLVIDHLAKLRQVSDGLLDSLAHVVVIPYCHDQGQIKLQQTKSSSLSSKQLEIFMSDFLEYGAGDPDRDIIRYEQLPFDHPLFILYSSGTTGKPKCIVHGAGGTLIKHLEEHRIAGNRYIKRNSSYLLNTYGTTQPVK